MYVRIVISEKLYSTFDTVQISPLNNNFFPIKYFSEIMFEEHNGNLSSWNFLGDLIYNKTQYFHLVTRWETPFYFYDKTMQDMKNFVI